MFPAAFEAGLGETSEHEHSEHTRLTKRSLRQYGQIPTAETDGCFRQERSEGVL